MTCPICDQKPANCDCTDTEKRQWSELEGQRLTDEEQAAIQFALGRLRGTLRGNEECNHSDALQGLLVRLGWASEETADEMERLSQKCDCRVPDNRANADKLGSKLVQDAANTLTDSERAAVSRAIDTLNVFQTNGGWHSAIDEDAATLERLLGRTQ